jgi:hypothetical protein
MGKLYTFYKLNTIIMTQLRCSIYQLTSSDKSFEVFNNLELPEEVDFDLLGDAVTDKLYRVFGSQSRITEVTGKHRFFGLAKSKPVYFSLTIDGVNVFNSQELPNSYGIKVKIGVLNKEQLSIFVSELLSLFLN